MKTKFNLDDSLPPTKMLRFYNIALVVRSVFHEGNSFSPVCIKYKCQNMIELICLNELMLAKATVCIQV